MCWNIDIGPTPFKIIEQKNVQHCETHMEAQSCKASYQIYYYSLISGATELRARSSVICRASPQKEDELFIPAIYSNL